LTRLGFSFLAFEKSFQKLTSQSRLTVYKDDDRIFRAMCAGACGYLLKNTPPVRLVQAIREIAEGGAVMSPEVAIRVVELFRKVPVREAGWVGLSPQEIRLLKLFTEGHQNKTAAAQLGISVHTVSFHLRSIYEKLHVHTRSEAVARRCQQPIVGRLHRQLSDGRHPDDDRRPQPAFLQGYAPGAHRGLGEARPRLLGVPAEEFVQGHVIDRT
jgi:DNA-binding CsgD family transcriptional regulator